MDAILSLASTDTRHTNNFALHVDKSYLFLSTSNLETSIILSEFDHCNFVLLV